MVPFSVFLLWTAFLLISGVDLFVAYVFAPAQSPVMLLCVPLTIGAMGSFISLFSFLPDNDGC